MLIQVYRLGDRARNLSREKAYYIVGVCAVYLYGTRREAKYRGSSECGPLSHPSYWQSLLSFCVRNEYWPVMRPESLVSCSQPLEDEIQLSLSSWVTVHSDL